MGRPRKSRAQHELEGSLYQHDYYMKRKSAKQEPQPADPDLVKQADEHRELWTYGYDKHNLLADPDRARELWQVVREQYMDWFKVGDIEPKWGTIEYGPWGWWAYDCPLAPFPFEPIPGLPTLYAYQHEKHLALKAWRYIPEGTPEPQLARRAKEIDTYYQRRVLNTLRGFWYPFPTGTSEEKQEAKWEEIKAEREAWARLGYLTD